MATSTLSSTFPTALVKEKIRQTMYMGMPPDEADQLTWFWKREKTYASADPAGVPYDFTDAPVTNVAANDDLDDDGSTDQSTIVPYALEFSSRPAGSLDTVAGEIDNARAVITLLLDDWQTVQTSDYTKIGEVRYNFQLASPLNGLFDMAVVTVFLDAEDAGPSAVID